MSDDTGRRERGAWIVPLASGRTTVVLGEGLPPEEGGSAAVRIESQDPGALP
ncbi:MAG: hypothetical protein OEZ65_02395 [Gemmatimonadota bacterium]|nr:hypothetical protein [Gemmatimonadota bacterium]MDH5758411.1 hypothetical protein [Gemmatimonadota bacterium]